MTLFTTAEVLLKTPQKHLGKWDFAALPSKGHALAMKINDRPVALLVESVIHKPVSSPALSGGTLEVPPVTIFVSMPDGAILDD